MNVVPTVSDLRESNFSENTLVRTLGYYGVGDGGGAEYLIKANRIADNLGSHELHNQLTATLFSAPYNVLQFGAKSWDGNLNAVTDSTSSFNAALTLAPTSIVHVPYGKYIINNLTATPRLVGSSVMTNPGDGSSGKPQLISSNEQGERAIFLNPLVGNVGYGRNVILKNLELNSLYNGGFAYKHESTNSAQRSPKYLSNAVFDSVTTRTNFSASYYGNFIFCRWLDCDDGQVGKYNPKHTFLDASEEKYGGQCNHNQFHRCRLFGGGHERGGTIAIYWGNNNSFQECDFEFCFGGVAKFLGGQNNTFSKCWIELATSQDDNFPIEPADFFWNVEYVTSGPDKTSQPRGIAITNCFVDFGTENDRRGVGRNGSLFKQIGTRSGGNHLICRCTFKGDRNNSVGQFNGTTDKMLRINDPIYSSGDPKILKT